VTEYGEDTLGGAVASAMTGTFMGIFWGFARVGSGLVDMFTFPFRSTTIALWSSPITTSKIESGA
jgi:hypothetical protein